MSPTADAAGRVKVRAAPEVQMMPVFTASVPDADTVLHVILPPLATGNVPETPEVRDT
jgi:hypothetical protein